MARKTRTSKRAQYCADKAIQSSRNALLAAICEDMYKEFVHNNNRLPYGHVTHLLHELLPKETWVTRNIINKAFIKYRASQKVGLVNKHKTTELPDSIMLEPNVSMISDLSNVSSCKKVGRPNGSTTANKETKKKRLIDAKNEVATIYAQMIERTKKNKTDRVRK